METPTFLTIEEVLLIHKSQIDLYGGCHGVRDLGLLESAIAQPMASFYDEFLCKDLYEMAAAYFFHVMKNHPFLDGNKRTGVAAALVFLEMHSIVLDEHLDDVDPATGNTQLELLALGVAQDEIGKPEISIFFKNHTKTSK